MTLPENQTPPKPHSPRRFTVAPMMDWTDRHCRAFHRQMTRHARLYTEMVTTGAVLHGTRERGLGFSPIEQPVAVQLGGSDPHDLALAARICEDMGYVEINLNVGCPSDRVQSGRFGACLMAEPLLVAECVAAMKAAVQVDVTVKCRIGIDDQDSEEALHSLTCALKNASVDALIVHARKAWLKGLSPRENRDVPPLDYARVYRLKAAHPELDISINGGIASIKEAQVHLQHVDGVMMGRAAYHEPWRLLEADSLLFGQEAPFSDAMTAAHAFETYLSDGLARGVRLSSMTRHTLGLFQGMKGARLFRRHLTCQSIKPHAGIEVWRVALAAVASP